MHISEDNITYWALHNPQAQSYDYWEWPQTLVLRGTIVNNTPHDLTMEKWQSCPIHGLFAMPWWYTPRIDVDEPMEEDAIEEVGLFRRLARRCLWCF